MILAVTSSAEKLPGGTGGIQTLTSQSSSRALVILSSAETEDHISFSVT